MRHLNDIIKGVSVKPPLPAVLIKNIRCDSRAVEKGDLFIAVSGWSEDGYKYIGDAISRGAKAVLADRDFALAGSNAAKIIVEDARLALPVLADNFYGHPSKMLKMIGVTGTNGKTTITYLIESIIKRAGKHSGVIGTINYRFGGREIMPATNTTPGPIELQAMLAEMLKRGAGYVIMEVSSHALDQRRADKILLDTAIFTNVTSEHLDYHKTITNYFKAKARIFDQLKKGGTAVLNSDDKNVLALKRKINAKAFTYGMGRRADIRAEVIELALGGSRFRAVTPRGSIDIETDLIGRHNVSNILAAIAASSALGISRDAIREGVKRCGQVPGRLEPIDAGQPFRVFVDFAHTEDALYNVLILLKEVSANKIITVFGCGGNRDRKKRPMMGRVACKYSDRVVITSDNPRFEEPAAIISEIEKGISGKFSNYDITVDRCEAIEKALEFASKGDIVLIAGKGHEKYQIIKDRMIPFDDREVAMSILKRMSW